MYGAKKAGIGTLSKIHAAILPFINSSSYVLALYSGAWEHLI
jgi:hypothetical protein